MLKQTKSPKWNNALEVSQRISEIAPGMLIIVFDTETTGLEEDAKIIQFSGVKCLVNDDMTLTEKDAIDLYINPEEKLSKKITEITGITQDIVDSARPEREVAQGIMNWLVSSYDSTPRKGIWAAYNANFDILKLRGMTKRVGLRFPVVPTEDILLWARKLLASESSELPSFKLGDVYEHFFPDRDRAFHNSLEDTKATAEVMQELIRVGLEYTPPEKRLVQVEKASPWISAYNGDQRIRLKLSEGEFGDIFYDVRRKMWSCKSTSSAKRLFEDIDMLDVESQYVAKYGWTVSEPTVDAIAKSSIQWLKSKKKSSRKKEA